MVITDRGTSIKKSGFIWLPKVTTAYKITVTRSDGTIDDISDLFNYTIVEHGVTDSIGSFEFEMWDPNETYLNVWTGTEVFKFYSDAAATATTLRFRGQIEKPTYKGNKIKCVGRGEALQVMDITVTKTYEDMETSLILKSLFDNYATQFTYTNVAASTKSITVNWAQKPFWECVKELCKEAGFDCYIDSSLDVHYFKSGSRTNEDDAIIHDQNMVAVSEFGVDISLIRNRIIVYGAEQEGIPIIYTAEDTASQNKYGLKEEIVNDNNIISDEQAQENGDYLLNKLKNPPDIGDVTGVLLATIQPGEQMKLSSPSDNLQPKNYDIISYKHSINQEKAIFTTSVKVSKEPRKVTHLIKDMIESGNKLKKTEINPHEMRNTQTFIFDTDVGTHTNTEITAGVLKIKTGDSGTWLSPVKTTSSNVSEVYLLVTGETLTGATYRISADNGANWEDVLTKERITLAYPGNNLLIEVKLSDPDTQIKSLGDLYK